jgi:hypothetical protein
MNMEKEDLKDQYEKKLANSEVAPRTLEDIYGKRVKPQQDVSEGRIKKTSQAISTEIQFIDIYTADPADINTPKRVFNPDDPFAIVAHIRVSDFVKQNFSTYDLHVQQVNPVGTLIGPDAWLATFFVNKPSDDMELTYITTIDNYWYDADIRWSDEVLWFWWNKYTDSNFQIINKKNPEHTGIFFVRGTINLKSSNYFDHSSEFWYKVDYVSPPIS